VVEYLTTTVLLLLLSTECGSEKKIENWLIFGEDMENDKVGRFLGDTTSVDLRYCTAGMRTRVYTVAYVLTPLQTVLYQRSRTYISHAHSLR